MYCNNCGKANPDNSNYCNSCGGRLQLLDNLSSDTFAVAPLEETKSNNKQNGSFTIIIPWVAFAMYAILLTTLATGSNGYYQGTFAARIGLRTIVSLYPYINYRTNYIGYFVYMGLGFIISLVVYKVMKNKKN